VALAELTARPVVLLLDGPGSRTRHPNDSSPWTGDELRGFARLAGRVPVVAAILGPVAGHDALLAAAADHVVMARRAAVFGAGPPLVFAATGVEVAASDLGGPSVHAGRLVDHVADDEPSAITAVRAHLVARVPASPVTVEAHDAPSVRAVLPADPTASYDPDALIGAIVDPGTWTRDVGPAAGLLTGTAAVAGRDLVVVASEPGHDDGRIDVLGADAAVERLRTAPDLPALLLVDSPGPALGADAEAAGAGRAVVVLLRAVAMRTAPSIVVIVRRAHGDVPTVLGLGPDAAVLTALALPGARLGPLPAETASEAFGRIADVDALVEHTEFGGAVDAAEQSVVDRVIDPDDLRAEIVAALRLLG
jgi:acetyl-CoA carboxylase carboxyltransferase component